MTRHRPASARCRRPDSFTSSLFRLWQCGHIGRGGKRNLPQSPQFWPMNCSLSAASQKNLASGVTIGARRVGFGAPERFGRLGSFESPVLYSAPLGDEGQARGARSSGSCWQRIPTASALLTPTLSPNGERER